MIYGVGVDLVTISRIKGVHERFGARFARRFLHDVELEQLAAAPDASRFLAKRFAVKEASVKALGTGERSGVLLRDFYVEHNELGKPLLYADGKAAELFEEFRICSAHLSLSDEGDQIAAFVVLEYQLL